MNTWLKFAVIAALLCSTSATFADRDDRGWRGNGNGWGNDRGWRGNDNYNNRPWYGGRVHDGRRNDSRVSVNLNFGTGYRVPPAPGIGWTWTSQPYGWRTFHSRPQAFTYSRPRTVIIQNHTYVTPGTTVTYGTVAPSSATSLLRDRHGRCYERSVDGLGNETRIELPATACNF